MLASPGEGEWRNKRDTGQFFPAHLPVTQHTGRNWLNMETVESCEGFRCLPERRRAPMHERRQHSEGHGSP